MIVIQSTTGIADEQTPFFTLERTPERYMLVLNFRGRVFAEKLTNPKDRLEISQVAYRLMDKLLIDEATNG